MSKCGEYYREDVILLVDLKKMSTFLIMFEGSSRPHIINPIYKKDFFFIFPLTILKVSFNSAP